MLIPEGCYARTSFASIAGERLSVCSMSQERPVSFNSVSTDVCSSAE